MDSPRKAIIGPLPYHRPSCGRILRCVPSGQCAVIGSEVEVVKLKVWLPIFASRLPGLESVMVTVPETWLVMSILMKVYHGVFALSVTKISFLQAPEGVITVFQLQPPRPMNTLYASAVVGTVKDPPFGLMDIPGATVPWEVPGG